MNSLRKGKRFEREVAKFFSTLLGAEVKRTPQSGGWDDSYSGDLYSEHWFFKSFVVECKFRNNWKWEDVLLLRKPVIDWIKQAETEGMLSKRIPILCFKRNRGNIYFILNWDLFPILKNISTAIIKNKYFLLTKEDFIIFYNKLREFYNGIEVYFNYR